MIILQEFSESLAVGLCNLNSDYDSDKKEVVAYGLEMIIANVLSVTAILLLSLFMGKFFETCIFLLCFMPLRTYTGGYHAKNHLRCFLILLFCICIEYLMLLYVSESIILIISLMGILYGAMVVMAFSPVIDKNHPLSKRQILKSRKYSIKIIIVLFIFALISLKINIKMLMFPVSYSIVITACSIIAVKIKNNVKGGKSI